MVDDSNDRMVPLSHFPFLKATTSCVSEEKRIACSHPRFWHLRLRRSRASCRGRGSSVASRSLPVWVSWLVKLEASRGPVGYGRGPLSPYRAIVRSTHIRLVRGDLRLERRVTTLPCLVYTGRGRDECPSSEGRTQPATLCYFSP